MIDLYYTLLLMSAIATTLYLILRFLSIFTQKYFTATWHYYSHVLLYSLFFIPYFKLVSFINLDKMRTVPNKNRLVGPVENVSRETPIPMIVSDASRSITTDSHQISHALMNIWNIVPYVFIFGTVTFLAVTLIQNVRIHHRIFSLCELTNDPDILRELSVSKQKLGMTKEISVYLSPYISSPFLYGLFKPRIVLPTKIDFTIEEYRQVFLHELIHYRRRDVWVKCLLISVNALHWFNPLAYVARRDADRYCELSCDEQIVQSMNATERRRYCELLLNVLWNVADQRVKLYSALSDKKYYLERRIRMILKNEGKPRKSVRLFATLSTLMIMIVGIFAVYAAVSAKELPLVSAQELGNGNGCSLVSSISKEIGHPVPVELIPASRETSDTFDEIKPGDCRRLGGDTLHAGDVVTLNYTYTGGDLKVYLLEYDAQTLEDGKLMASNSNYTIPANGHYYLLLQNRSQNGTTSKNINITVQTQIN